MSEQTVTATFGPAFWGFAAAILLFILQEWIRTFFQKQQLINALKFELDCNLHLLDIFDGFVNHHEKKKSNPAIEPPHPDYSALTDHFIKKLHESGLTPLYFTADEKLKWHEALVAQKQGALDSFVFQCTDNRPPTLGSGLNGELVDIYSAEGDRFIIDLAKTSMNRLRNKLDEPLLPKLIRLHIEGAMQSTKMRKPKTNEGVSQ